MQGPAPIRDAQWVGAGLSVVTQVAQPLQCTCLATGIRSLLSRGVKPTSVSKTNLLPYYAPVCCYYAPVCCCYVLVCCCHVLVCCCDLVCCCHVLQGPLGRRCVGCVRPEPSRTHTTHH